jgi:iron complex outermembrane receptor protein
MGSSFARSSGAAFLPIVLSTIGLIASPSLGNAQEQQQPPQQQTAPPPASTDGAAQLPPVTVQTKEQPRKPARKAATKKGEQTTARKVPAAAKQAAAPPAAAPAPSAAPPSPAGADRDAAPAETATSPVPGYVATRSATGSKTDTPILETPQAISVVTADQVRDQGAQSISEALRYTPGVSIELNGASSRYSEARIRGFLPVQYLDGLAVPLNQFFATPRIEPYGMERIEALKGPASFLFGQNSPGGLLNMVSKRPTDYTFNEVQFQVGSFNRYQTAFDFGGPANGSKELLYRFTGVVRDADTEVDFTRDDLFFVAPSFTWRPSADTSITVLAHYSTDKGTYPHQYVPPQGVVLPNPNGRIPRSRFLGEPGFDKFDREQFAIGYELQHRVNDVWQVRQNLRYFGVDVFFNAIREEGFNDDTLTTVNRNAFSLATDAGTFTVDNQAQADFNTGALRHTALFGLDYFRTSGNYDFRFVAVDPINVFDPVYGAPIGPLAPLQKNHSVQDQIGIYAQDQIRYRDWILTLGGRNDWVDNSTDDLLANTAVSREDSHFTGRAALTYVFPSGLAPYISYATSFQPTIGVNADGQPLIPTTGEQYEIGVKYQPTSRTLVTLAAFDVTQQNALTFDTLGIPSQIGEVRVRGFDIDARSQLTENFSVIAGYAFLDSETTESSNPDEVGNVVPLVPRHQASLWAKYEFREGLLEGVGLGGGVRYVGTTYAEPTNSLAIPDYTLFDAAVSYDLGVLSPAMDGAELALNVTNVFDKYYASGYCDLTYCSLGAGRTFLTTLRYKW